MKDESYGRGDCPPRRQVDVLAHGRRSVLQRRYLARCATVLLLWLGVAGLAVRGHPLSSAAFAAEPLRFSIMIKNRNVEASHKTLRVAQGTTVELTFTTDEAAELHLHGYDHMLAVAPAAPAVLRLDATIAGRFAIEAHRFGGGAAEAGTRRYAHVVLFYLEVYPW